MNLELHPQEIWRPNLRRIAAQMGGCWQRILLTCLSLACLGFCWGWLTAESVSSAKLMLLPQNVLSGTNEMEIKSMSQRHLNTPSMVVAMNSSTVLEKMAEKTDLAISKKDLEGRIHIQSITNTDLFIISYRNRKAERAVKVVEAYAQACVEMAGDYQRQEIEKYCRLLADLSRSAQEDSDRVEQELFDFLNTAGFIDYAKDYSYYHNQLTDLSQKGISLQAQLANLEAQIKSLLEELAKNTPALVTAKEALDQALLRYTEEHPKVKELRAAASSIEKQLAEQGPKLGPEVVSKGNPVVSALYTQVIELRHRRLATENQIIENDTAKTVMEKELRGFPEKQKQYQKLKAQQRAAQTRLLQVNRQREAIQLGQQATPAILKVFEPARIQKLNWAVRLKRGAIGGGAGAFLTLMLMVFVMAKEEFRNHLIRDETDLQIATQLPLVGKLPDLAQMDPTAQDQWAFWTLRQLKNRLAPTAALICGFTSARAGEGRSTWMNLLAEAARKQGLLVVCLDARNNPSGSMAQPNPPHQGPGLDDSQALLCPVNIVEIAKTQARSSSVQAHLDSWIWSLEKRHQWESGMEQLSKLDNLVFLTALPTATEPAMALLAESLPNIIWIGAQGESDLINTRHQVNQLKNSRIRLAGAGLNKAKA